MLKVNKKIASLFSPFGRACTPGQTQTRLGSRIYYSTVLPPAAVLNMPKLDSSDNVKPALSFMIQTCQTSCSMWCPMYGAYY